MSIAEEFRTGNAVVRGELTLDPERAREKLRDNRLTDPHRWILELVAAAHHAQASYVRVDLDADEFLVHIGGTRLEREELENIWQAPFARESRAFTRHLAFGLIAAEALTPSRILLRSGSHEAMLGPRHDRGLLERVTTQLYPESGMSNAVQIYVKLPLAMERVFSRVTELPEVKYLHLHATYADVPVFVSTDQVNKPVDADVGERHLTFDRSGLRGVMEVTSASMANVTFVQHGVISENIAFESVVPVRGVVRTDRLNYDLSGTKIIRDEALEGVLNDLREIAREALLAHMSPPGGFVSVAEHVRAKVLFKLVEENYLKRIYYEPISEIDVELGRILRKHPLWASASPAPARASRWPQRGVALVSLEDACPDQKFFNWATEKLSVGFGDRLALLGDNEDNILTPLGLVPVKHLERFLEVESHDITQKWRTNRKREAAEARWRAAEWITNLRTIAHLNFFVETDRVGVAYTASREPERIEYVHQDHVLGHAPGLRGVYAVLKRVAPNEDMTGPADVETTRQDCAALGEAAVSLARKMAAGLTISPNFGAEHFHGLQHLVDALLSRDLPARLSACGVSAKAAEVNRATLASVPMFATLARERVLLNRSRKVLTTRKSVFDGGVQALVSADDVRAAGRSVAMCRPADFEKLAESGFADLLMDSHTVLVGDAMTSRFVRTLAEVAVTDAMELMHAAQGRQKFIARKPEDHALPRQTYYASTSHTTDHGRMSLGLEGVMGGKLTVRYRHQERWLEEVSTPFVAGDIVVVVDDTRLKPDRTFERVLRDTGFDAVTADVRAAARALVFDHIRNARSLAGAPTNLLRSLWQANDPDLRTLELFEDTEGKHHPLTALQHKRRVLYVQRGFAPIDAMAQDETVYVFEPNFDLEPFGIQGVDISDSPAHQHRLAKAREDFENRPNHELGVRRTIDPTANPKDGVALASMRFEDGEMQGVVAFVGATGRFARVTVLHQHKMVATHTVPVPWGEFEVVIEHPKVELDPYFAEVIGGLRAYDTQIADACKRCLLGWLRRPTHNEDVMKSVKLSQSALNTWSREFGEALRPKPRESEPKAEPQRVKVVADEAPKGPEDDLFGFLETVVGASGVLANVAVRGFELHELGTGLPCQAEGNVVHIDPTHPVNKAALGTDDPVWKSMAASSAFTALNLRWLAITDDHEEEFSSRMLAYMAKALG